MAHVADTQSPSGLTARQRRIAAYALGGIWLCYSAALLAWDLIEYPPAYTCITRH